MAFRSKEMFKKIIKKVGEENLAPGVKESLKKFVPDSKVVMGRAKRGLYAGRHIQFGDKVSEDGGNKSRRTWKPNVQEKRLFSYILDRHIRVKVTTHALRCIDKAGGIDEYLLKTPYQKMDTEMGLFWKAKIEKMYEELGEMDVGFFSPEEEAKLEQGFKDLKLAEREARREARRKEYKGSGKQKQITERSSDVSVADQRAGKLEEESKFGNAPEPMVANS
ncbi:Ribosomal protein L28 [Macleaya cordata]|uniref:Large ribosomal subunit protein bL28m n=1 Tax=Macleaya cordata TaxID=56857 RepID=A0A200PRT2_MACCD|nr:Ribosomal protein L28 [Macleaya cordata]